MNSKSLLLVVLLQVYHAHALSVEEHDHFSKNVTIEDGGDSWIVLSNGLPEHETDDFPTPTNPDRHLKEQDHRFAIPKEPKEADEPGCLPFGPIGFGINGCVFFRPYTGHGHNAVEGENREYFDMCNGHPSKAGVYHYHMMPICLYNETMVDQYLGVALDGYGIYGPKTKDGAILTSSDLDTCHGRTDDDGVYRYRITFEFPYILGCFHGVLDPSMQETPSHVIEVVPVDGNATDTNGTSIVSPDKPKAKDCKACRIADEEFPEGCSKTEGDDGKDDSERDVSDGAKVNKFSVTSCVLVLLVSLFI